MAIGDAGDLRKTADLLDSITGEIAAIYAERSGRPVDFWLGQMAAETWYTDQQAVADGLADSILGQEPAAAASWDLSVFGNAPGAVVVNADGNHAPMTGEPQPRPSRVRQRRAATELHSHRHDHGGDAATDASHGHCHDGQRRMCGTRVLQR